MKKMRNKKLALIISLLMLSATAVFAETAAADAAVPPDVRGAAYETAVTALVEKGIITGDTDGKFYPESNLSRAQACIIIVKSMNPPVAEVEGTATQPVLKSGFSDMSGYGWAEGYIGYAVKHGITKGYPDKTFKPGNKVTMNELITMVLRAAGYNDEAIGGTWPSNYVSEAEELNLLSGITTPLPNLATKWMAAQMDYNALEKIEAANPPEETSGQGTDQDKPDALPDTASMAFGNASFNDKLTSFGGKTISDDVVIYAYGKKADYSSTMTFSKKLSDYREDTVYKYKSVKTQAFYKVENGEITVMVLPMDVGFSGKAYGVINGKISTLNGEGDTVNALETLTATYEITWLAKKSANAVIDAIPYAEYQESGEVYEIVLSNGQITGVYKSSDPGKKNALFTELSGTGFVTVDYVKSDVIKIEDGDGGAMFEINDNVSVYILDEDDPSEYKAGNKSSVRDGSEIRAYDALDDDKTCADIIVILK